MAEHKHKDVIIAWANGAKIEYLSERYLNGEYNSVWITCVNPPSWHENDTYRVKPEVVKPKWPESGMSEDELYDAYASAYGCFERYRSIANAAIAHALETGLVVLPSTNTNSSVQNINYKKDAETWGGALNEAAWEFIENNPEKSALLFNTCKGSLRDAILKYLERVEGNSL